MIFPQFENIEVIDKIREKYDPLAFLARPHITLVFPFEHPMSNSELESVLDKRLSDIPAFDLEMQGFAKQEDIGWGHWLSLDVTRGEEMIRKIHDVLYENELSSCKVEFPYAPHMTVGRLFDKAEADAAYDSIKSNDTVFSTKVDKISVEMIGPHEESIIIIEKSLI